MFQDLGPIYVNECVKMVVLCLGICKRYWWRVLYWCRGGVSCWLALTCLYIKVPTLSLDISVRFKRFKDFNRGRVWAQNSLLVMILMIFLWRTLSWCRWVEKCLTRWDYSNLYGDKYVHDKYILIHLVVRNVLLWEEVEFFWIDSTACALAFYPNAQEIPKNLGLF